jgi:hypothetical protein
VPLSQEAYQTIQNDYFAGLISFYYEGRTIAGQLTSVEILYDVRTREKVGELYGLYYDESNTLHYFGADWYKSPSGQVFGEPPPPPPPPTEVVLSISGPTSVIEADKDTQDAVYTIFLDRAVDYAVSVNYATADGSAVAGEDYNATTGSITFLPFETSRQVPVPVVGDTRPEPLKKNSAFPLVIQLPQEDRRPD